MHPQPLSRSNTTTSTSTRQNLSAQIPYENYAGAVLDGRYRIQRLKLRHDFLDVYAVTDLCGSALFEAKAFSPSCPPSYQKLLRSRERKVRRLFDSRGFRDEVRQAGRRFLVSRVERSAAEWDNLCFPPPKRRDSADVDDPNVFPHLSQHTASRPCSQLSYVDDHTDRPASRASTAFSNCSTYAEAAASALGQTPAKKPVSGKAVRQSRRRKRRRDERRQRKEEEQ